MKAIIILLVGLMFASCELEDNVNKSTDSLNVPYMTQQEVNYSLLGKYKTLRYDNSKGSIEITKERITINVDSYRYYLNLTEYRTISVVDCYFDVYLPDGTVIRISDFVIYGNKIMLMVNGQAVCVLEKVEREEPAAPVEPAQEPEPPVMN